MQPLRRIIHIDMDCFYASVEMRERPELSDKPVAVGGSSGRGVLTTCNYVARKYGIRSAMPVFKARKLCPHLIVLPVRLDLYRQASQQIRSIFKRYTDLVEPLSLDEAYLDVTRQKRRGADIAQEIRNAIYDETRLTASAGIGPNKLVAKIASDWNKPNGQCVVSPSKVRAFMHDLPVRCLWGVGPKSAARLSEMDIETCGDLQRYSRSELATEFGSFGPELYCLCRGIDDRPVQPNRIRKSLGNERTFDKNIETLEACEEALKIQHKELLEKLQKKAVDRQIAKILVKLKFSDFRRTTAESSSRQPELGGYLKLLHQAWGRSGRSIRLLGIGVRFADTRGKTEQLELGL
jgi:DNA polymerase-4